MKNLFVVAFATLLALPAMAQQQKRNHGMSDHEKIEMRVEKMAERLELSENQKEQVLEIQKAHLERMENHRKQMHDIQQKYHSSLNEVLNEEQRIEFTQMKSERMEEKRENRKVKGMRHLKHRERQMQRKAKEDMKEDQD